MKNTLLLMALAATLPVQAADETGYSYTYALEGQGASVRWVGAVGEDTADLMLQVQEREIKDTQGRPVKLQIRPVEIGGYAVEFRLEGLSPDAEVQWTGDLAFAKPESVQTTYTLSPQGGTIGKGKADMVYSFQTVKGKPCLAFEVTKEASPEDMQMSCNGQEVPVQLVSKSKGIRGNAVRRFSVPSTEGISVTLTEMVAAEKVQKTVPVTFTLKPRAGADMASTVPGDFRVLGYQSVTEHGSLVIWMLSLEPITPKGAVVRSYDLPRGRRFGKFQADKESTPLLLLADEEPLEGATLPVDATIPATTKGGTTLQLRCKGSIPLPPEVQVTPAAR